MVNEPKYGIYDLSGPAVQRSRDIVDDNHSDAADEGMALRNFSRFSDSFFKTQNRFLNDEKLSD
ncbi:MAG: hypothetical protein RIC18_06085 [Hoeflea sp.]|uniref:hypothetical protein n=1 Tax=Hoeflea sp. TaxID=1940281 RepID=UPI0032ED524A